MENIFEVMASVLKPTEIIIGNDFIGFDFKIKKELIYTGNLPEKVKELINSVEKIEISGSWLHGSNDRQLVFSANNEYWSKEDLIEHAQYMKEEERKKPHFYINSIGGKLNGQDIQFHNGVLTIL